MSIVDNLLVMVDNHDSSSKTGEAKLPEYLTKRFHFWNLSVSIEFPIKKFIKEQNSDLLVIYYDAMRARFDKWYFCCIFLFLSKKVSNSGRYS